MLLHENEKAIYGDVPERVLDLVESVGSSALRLAWDNANFVQVGVRPLHRRLRDAAAVPRLPAGEGLRSPRRARWCRPAKATGSCARPSPRCAMTAMPATPRSSRTWTKAFELGGFSGPTAFGQAARAFAELLGEIGVVTR